MKTRLLLILAIGIAFAPAVFADGTSTFQRPDDISALDCAPAIDHAKDLDSDVANNNSDSGSNSGHQSSADSVN